MTHIKLFNPYKAIVRKIVHVLAVAGVTICFFVVGVVGFFSFYSILYIIYVLYILYI